MKAIRIVAAHGARETLRNQTFVTALCFSGVLLYVSVLLGALAVDQEVRVLADFGLSFIELMGLLLVVFGAANGILREMDTKTIYLVLSRPVPRAAFLLGRYLGLLASAALAVGAMALAHLSLLFLRGWAWNEAYCLALFGILLKLAIASALAMLLALISTSLLSALTMTGVVWILGHFLPELRFLVRRLPEAWLRPFFQGFGLLLPNLQLLNFRDRLDWPGFHGFAIAAGAGYALSYAASCLALAYGLFRKREF